MDSACSCPRCSATEIVKNGFLRGAQRYKCKSCSYNFVDKPKSDNNTSAKKALAVVLYNLGLSLRATGKVCGVSATSVLNWVSALASEHATKPEPPKDGVVVIELDEMHHYLKKIQQTLDLESVLS